MGRRELSYVGLQDFSGGINCNEPRARPNELRDALNMWVHEGVCQTRPGTRYVPSFNAAGFSYALPSVVQTSYIGQDAATGTNELQGGASYSPGAAFLQSGDHVYFRLGSVAQFPFAFQTSYISTTPANADFILEYYNGTSWIELETVSYGTLLYWQAPTDQATYTIEGISSEYWLRLTWQETLSACAFTGFNIWFKYPVQTPLFVYRSPTTNLLEQFFASHYNGVSYFDRNPEPGSSTTYRVTLNSFDPGVAPYHKCCTVNNLRDSVLISVEGILLEWDAESKTWQQLQVETNPLFVGTAGTANNGLVDYHIDEIAQLSQFPRAGLIKFFGSKIWLAQIEGNPGMVRWSAPFPAHHVMPAMNFEYCTGDDPSDIQAFGTLGENLVIIKANSFWNVVYAGNDALTGSLESYQMVKQVTGAGTRAAGSVQEIAGHIYCLGDGQVYEYDGQVARNIGEKIHKHLLRINKSLQHIATSCYWEHFGLYMLAVPMDGAKYNTHILIYDTSYNDATRSGQTGTGAWWIWQLPDDMQAVQLQLIEGDVYILDQIGNLHKFCELANDNGVAIDAFIETHDQLRNDTMTKEAREVRVVTSNDVASIDFNVTVNDTATPHTTGSVVITDQEDGLFSSWHLVSGHGQMTLGTRDFREKHVGIREVFRRARIKISSAAKNQRLYIQSVLLGFIKLGRR